MEFIKDLKEKEYRDFWRSTPNNHFMQSYEWGQVQKKSRDQIPCYVGLKDNGKLVAAALLLKKKTPLNMCYFYVPRGFTLDYSDEKVVTEFTKHLKEYLKEENAIYLKIDPPLMYQEIDEEANPVKDGLNNYDVYENFIKLGYKHQGFNKLYEGNQPRYTFRTYFKKYASFDEVEKTFSKSFSKPLKRSYDYDLEIYEADEVKTFHELIKIISERDGFNPYSFDYYNNVFNELKKDNLVKVFNAKINPSKLIKKFEEQVKNDHNEDRKKRTLKDIEFLKGLPNQKEYTCASLICTYSESGAWSLYIGNDEAAIYTGTVNRLYYEFIKDAYENNYDYADLFGVVGDPHTKFKNLAGIYEYKRKIGGDYIEFIGEFDLINKPFWYKVLPILLKIYRKIKK
ncbi:MAG: peptidoglycan bridge formation glycyltransferase FemA/FemB family protein [Bacilli bacterium]|nr:peptidoglycan bridge formation glycyltransferase FemA/FemB family protein [Bacilli bacterium]